MLDNETGDIILYTNLLYKRIEDVQTRMMDKDPVYRRDYVPIRLLISILPIDMRNKAKEHLKEMNKNEESIFNEEVNKDKNNEYHLTNSKYYNTIISTLEYIMDMLYEGGYLYKKQINTTNIK